MKGLVGSLLMTLLVTTAVFMLLEVDTAEAQGSATGGRRNRQSRQNNRRGRNRNRNRGRGRAGRRGRGRQTRWQRYGCEEIYLPMCKGLINYTHTKLPNRFNHTTQDEVFRHLQVLTGFMDHSCSRNMRLLACSMYLPKCHGRRPGIGPCRRTCTIAQRKCSEPLTQQLGLVNWDDRFSCEGLPNRRCVRPMRDTRCTYRYPHCLPNNDIPVCRNLTFTHGTLPNMFSQCHAQDINLELRQYDSLRATNCHPSLDFLLCGVHSPFCGVRNDAPFNYPCRELCEEVRRRCESDYRRLNHNLTWPHKLQCHRYPTSDDTDYNCVMPNEGPGTSAAPAA